MFFAFVIKHVCDRQTDGQNYDPQDCASIPASCGKNHARFCMWYGICLHCTARGVSVLPRNQSNSTYAVAKCTIFLPAICPRPLKGSQPNSPHRSQMDWNRKHGVKIMKCAGGQVGGAKMAEHAYGRWTVIENVCLKLLSLKYTLDHMIVLLYLLFKMAKKEKHKCHTKITNVSQQSSMYLDSV